MLQSGANEDRGPTMGSAMWVVAVVGGVAG